MNGRCQWRRFEGHAKNKRGQTIHGQAPKGGLERDAPNFRDQLTDMLKYLPLWVVTLVWPVWSRAPLVS